MEGGRRKTRERERVREGTGYKLEERCRKKGEVQPRSGWLGRETKENFKSRWKSVVYILNLILFSFSFVVMSLFLLLC